ncbi:LAMI_0E15654g1_1 [Lachancea mirantina]|uniref:LAMI_0E15654g1_1 n=1 Tax=Lachancea mirantina TaxID=1230905 RepID=A0A1G4JSJ1_9SACH|nr:LAMI_0E15654g1_1 [Lachancea mirantina]
MTVAVKSRSKSLKDMELPGGTKTVEDALTAISKANRNISKNRIRLTYLKETKQVAITSDDFFTDGCETQVFVKDIGPQVSWRLVFCVEYIGPILVHSLFYWLSTTDFGAKLHSPSRRPNPFVNQLAYYMVIAHYTKRELESLFLHKFSHATMPLFNIFKNSFHYWVLSGAISAGYFGYGFPLTDAQLFRIYSMLKLNNLSRLIGLFALSEVWNFYVHYKLRKWGDAQKKKGVIQRVPLEDGIFKIFVAPNYTFEVLSWFFFTVVFKLNLFAVFFLFVSAGQMYLWAMKKNKKYGTKRAFLIPFVF